MVFRYSDIIARYGGEEFLIVVPDCGMNKIKGFAQRLLHIIEGENVETDEGPIPITVSLGLTVGVGNDQTSEIVKRADEALYRAKNNGRNRYETSDSGKI